MGIKKFWEYKYLAGAIALLCLSLSAIFIWHDNDHKFIKSDGIGYYSYLPAIFIDSDLDFNNTVKLYSERDGNIPPKPGECIEGNLLCDEYIGLKPLPDGRWLNKYPVGLALIFSPFFFIADGFVQLSGGVRDGISAPYQFAIVLCALVWLQIGLFFAFKALRTRFSKNMSLLLIIFLILGTNLLHYTVSEPSMSHVYSFALISGSIYLLDKYLARPSNRLLFLLGLFISLITLIRNFNILVGLIILSIIFFNTPKSSRFKILLIIILIWGVTFSVIMIPQLAYWHYSTGQWIIFSYGNERFNFLEPKILNVLFELRANGLFFWHPQLMLVIPGIWYWLKSNDKIKYFGVIFLIISTYAIASWWAYWFGYAFGHRAFTDYFIFFMIPIGYFFMRLGALKLNTRIIIAIIIGILIVLSINNMNLYWRGIVASHNYNWENYLNNFANPHIDISNILK